MAVGNTIEKDLSPCPNGGDPGSSNPNTGWSDQCRENDNAHMRREPGLLTAMDLYVGDFYFTTMMELEQV
jgi:hypothetical protein